MADNNKLITEFVFKGSFDVLKKYNAQMLAAVKLINKFTGKTDDEIKSLESAIDATDEMADKLNDMNAEMADATDQTDAQDDAVKDLSKNYGVMGASLAFMANKMKKLKPTLKGTLGGMKKMAGFATKVTAGVYGMATAVTAFGAAKLNKEADFARFAKRSGESYGRLKQLDSMAKAVGADDGAMLGTLKNMQGAIGDAEIEGSEAFSRLGLTARDAAGNIKPATQLFEEAREAFQTRTGDLSLGAKQNLASQIGIGEDMIDLLLMGQNEYDELTKRNAVFLKMNDKDRDASIGATNKLNELKSRFDAAGQKMASAMAPAIIEAVDTMINFMDKYAPAFESFAERCSQLFSSMASAVTGLIDDIASLADKWLPQIYAWLKKVWDWLGGMFGGENFEKAEKARKESDDGKKTAQVLPIELKNKMPTPAMPDIGMPAIPAINITNEQKTASVMPIEAKEHLKELSKITTDASKNVSAMPMQQTAQNETTAQINQNIKMEINGSDPRRTATAAVNFLQQSPNRIKSGQVSAA